MRPMISWWAAAMGAEATFRILSDASAVPGDFDRNDTVTVSDYLVLADCLWGPNDAPSPTCPVTPQDCRNAFDFDDDEDVDLEDFAEFQLVFTGGSLLTPGSSRRSRSVESRFIPGSLCKPAAQAATESGNQDTSRRD